MKFLSLSLTLILSILLSSQQGFARDGEGGVHGGGGNEIESGFKTKVLSILKGLIESPPSAVKKLKFNPNQLATLLQQQGRFQPLCAKDKILDQLQRDKKMAMVFSDRLSIVNLDCEKYSRKTWKKLFESYAPENIVFFLHEALRVAGNENEDDYSVSSSYLEYRNEMDIINKEKQAESDRIHQDAVMYISSLLSSNSANSRCELKTDYTWREENCGHNVDYKIGNYPVTIRPKAHYEMYAESVLFVDGIEVGRSNYKTKIVRRSPILSINDLPAYIIDRLYETAQKYNCTK